MLAKLWGRLGGGAYHLQRAVEPSLIIHPD